MLKKEILRKACFRAIDNILYEGTTDVELFNRAFEIDYLKDEDVREELCSMVCSSIQKNSFSELKLHKLGHVLVPKKSLSDYRKCALIDIYDEIVYLTLVISIADEIEKMRINKSKDRVFSYRFGSFKGKLFDSKFHYTAFRQRALEKSKYTKNKVVVECDISNFYDRLNIHRIESILRSNSKIDESIISLINELLLYWANRDSYGLPVGSNASRILAEVALIEVDNYLISKGIDFCRFVDDYRIFAKNAFEAHSNLALLTLKLSKEGMFLNTQKTKVKDISSYNKQNLSSDVDNAQNDVTFDEVDNEHPNLPKIIRGYSGLIASKFRKLSNIEIEKLKENDLDKLINDANNSMLIEEKTITAIIRTIIAKEEYRRLTELPNILKKFPQFIPYFIDAVIKCESISKDALVKIQNDFEEWMTNVDVPEYIQVYLVRIYSTHLLENKEILLNSFRNLKRNSGDYIGRALLESLDGKLSRGELLEIRDYYYRADKWEERQILKMISSSLSKGEKRAFFKDIKIHEDDYFINKIVKDSGNR